MTISPYIDFAYRLGSGLSSLAIAYWGGGGWAHVDMIDDMGQWWGARSDSVGGRAPGFWPRPPDYETALRKLMILRLPVTQAQKEAFWSKAHSIMGDPYNKAGIVAFALANSWSTKGAYFCSQASAMLKLSAGIMHDLHQNLIKVTPGDDALMVAALGGQEQPLPQWFAH
jgi:hypothetical protein